MTSFDVVTVGDVFIDTFLGIHNAKKYCEVNAAGQMCFQSGAKIVVDSADFELGGNACNVAVGLSRLGFATVLAAETGTDEFSEKILHGLKENKVSLDLLKQTAGAKSTFSMVLNFFKDRIDFVHHEVREHAISLDGVSAKYVYLTSLGQKWHGLYQTVLEYVHTTRTPLIFNPGSHQIQEGRESFKDILASTYLLIVNKEEAEEIVYGTLQHTDNPANSIETLLAELKKFGPKIVVITNGRYGTSALDEDDNLLTQAITPAHLVEPTGAGDAFGTGIVAALLSGKNLQEALLWGALNAASVVEHIGAQKGLLTKEALEERMKAV